jgi:hypothetical protein
LKFQIPDFDENTTITQANLELFGYNYNSSNPIQLEFLLADNTWDEELVTWNNKPAFIESTPVQTFDYPLLNGTSGIIDIDILPLLEIITENTLTIAIRIKSFVEGGGLIKFASKENLNGHPIPRLALTTSTDNVQVSNVMNPFIVMYPNPVKDGRVTIASEKSLSEIILYSVNGNILLRQKVDNESRIRIDVSDIHSGVYIIQSTNVNGEQTISRLIIR